jgi:hypothetical protein
MVHENDSGAKRSGHSGDPACFNGGGCVGRGGGERSGPSDKGTGGGGGGRPALTLSRWARVMCAAGVRQWRQGP